MSRIQVISKRRYQGNRILGTKYWIRVRYYILVVQNRGNWRIGYSCLSYERTPVRGYQCSILSPNQLGEVQLADIRVSGQEKCSFQYQHCRQCYRDILGFQKYSSSWWSMCNCFCLWWSYYMRSIRKQGQLVNLGLNKQYGISILL